MLDFLVDLSPITAEFILNAVVMQHGEDSMMALNKLWSLQF